MGVCPLQSKNWTENRSPSVWVSWLLNNWSLLMLDDGGMLRIFCVVIPVSGVTDYILGPHYEAVLASDWSVVPLPASDWSILESSSHPGSLIMFTFSLKNLFVVQRRNNQPHFISHLTFPGSWKLVLFLQAYLLSISLESFSLTLDPGFLVSPDEWDRGHLLHIFLKSELWPTIGIVICGSISDWIRA